MLVVLTVCYTVNLTILLHPVLKDYPSIAHLVQKLSDNNIQTIFAVTEEFQPVYQVCSPSISSGSLFLHLTRFGFTFIPVFWSTLLLVPSVCGCVFGRCPVIKKFICSKLWVASPWSLDYFPLPCGYFFRPVHPSLMKVHYVASHASKQQKSKLLKVEISVVSI